MKINEHLKTGWYLADVTTRRGSTTHINQYVYNNGTCWLWGSGTVALPKEGERGGLSNIRTFEQNDVKRIEPGVIRPTIITKHSSLDAVTICRLNGWRVGTTLRVIDMEDLQYRITAIGETSVIVLNSTSHRETILQNFYWGDWREVVELSDV